MAKLKLTGSEPVYPHTESFTTSFGGTTQFTVITGITLREQFAALAMAAILSKESGDISPKAIAQRSVTQADFLIKELNNAPTI